MPSTSPERAAVPFPPQGWKHGVIPVIGVTGAIGSGKSQVASILARQGAVLIDADRVGHEVLEDAEVRRALHERFGPEIFRGGQVDRGALGAIVFSDRAALRALEAVLHPRMLQRFREIIEREVERAGALAIVLDAAILLEAGWDVLCDLIVFVEASTAVRLARVARARGWTAEVLEARESAQWPADLKRGRADVRIRNEADLPALERNVKLFLESLRGFPPPEGRSGGSASNCLSYPPVPTVPGPPR